MSAAPYLSALPIFIGGGAGPFVNAIPAILVDANGNATGFTLSGTQILMPDGAVGAPSYSFTNEPNSGLYRPAAGQVGLAILGAGRHLFAATTYTLTATGATIMLNGTGATLIGNADLTISATNADLVLNTITAGDVELEPVGDVLLNPGSNQVKLSGTTALTMAGGVYAPGTTAPFNVLSTSSTAIGATNEGNRTAIWDYFDTNTSITDGAILVLNSIQRSGAGTIKRTGIHAKSYTQPDNGGDTSAGLFVQSGGGNALSAFKRHELIPAGYTDYSSSPQGAIEAGTSDQSYAILAHAGMGATGYRGTCVWGRTDNSVSDCFLATPNDGTFDTRTAYTVGSRNINAAPTNVTFQVLMNGATTWSPVAVAGGAATLTLTPGAHTAVVAEAIDYSYAAHTITITGGYATQRFATYAAPSVTAASSLTLTTAATFSVAGSPIALASAVITHPLSVWVQGGFSEFDGNVAIGSTATSPALNSTLIVGGTIASANGSQTGVLISTTTNTSATTIAAGVQVTVTGAAGTYSTADVVGVVVNANVKGSVQTISQNTAFWAKAQTIACTTAYGLRVDQISGGGTNNYGAFITNPSGTGAICLALGGLIGLYNNILTGGLGVPAIYKYTRPAQQVNATVTLATYTLPASDGSFEISANINVTVSTTVAMTVTCSYTDEANVARVLTIPFFLLAGTLVQSITTAQGNIAYESLPITIRAKASTTITIATAGTVTAVTYTGEGRIVQIA